MHKMINWIEDAYKLGIEVIIVHDTTIVDTLDTCDALEKFKSLVNNLKIKVITGNFGNPGAARNAGIEVVNGDWLVFWDADDEPDSVSLIEVINSAQANKYEIAISSFKKNTNGISVSDYEITEIGSERLERALVRNLGLWRFAFLSEIVGANRFISSKMAEDQVFVSALGIFSKKIYTTHIVTYEYFLGNPNQLTRQKKSINQLSISIKETFKTSQKQVGINKKVSEYFFVNQVFAALIHSNFLAKVFALWFLTHQTFKNPRMFKVFIKVLVWKIT